MRQYEKKYERLAPIGRGETAYRKYWGDRQTIQYVFEEVINPQALDVRILVEVEHHRLQEIKPA